MRHRTEARKKFSIAVFNENCMIRIYEKAFYFTKNKQKDALEHLKKELQQ